MKWTKEQPKVEGHYWFRRDHDKGVVCYRIVLHEGVYYAIDFYQDEGVVLIPIYTWKGDWSDSPLPLPEEDK